MPNTAAESARLAVLDAVAGTHRDLEVPEQDRLVAAAWLLGRAVTVCRAAVRTRELMSAATAVLMTPDGTVPELVKRALWLVDAGLQDRTGAVEFALERELKAEAASAYLGALASVVGGLLVCYDGPGAAALVRSWAA